MPTNIEKNYDNFLFVDELSIRNDSLDTTAFTDPHVSILPPLLEIKELSLSVYMTHDYTLIDDYLILEIVADMDTYIEKFTG